MISKNMALSDKYGNLMKFIAYTLEEPTTKQQLDTSPKNTPYISNTSVKSIVDAMNFYFEIKTLPEINDASFISLCVGKVENSSPKEYFSMFATYFSKELEKIDM